MWSCCLVSIFKNFVNLSHFFMIPYKIEIRRAIKIFGHGRAISTFGLLDFFHRRMEIPLFWPSSYHICRIPTPGALILNQLQEAKTTEKSWLLTTNSKFNAICCWAAAVLHPNWSELDHHLIVSFEEKAKIKKVGNLN